MNLVVDTCILIDVLVNDPKFGRLSALCLKRYVREGLVICPVTMVELSPAFEGNIEQQKAFLKLCGISYDQNFSNSDIVSAHEAWNRYVTKKRLKSIPKRPVADIMIGAFAERFEGLITRNQRDFEPWFSNLKLIVPDQD